MKMDMNETDRAKVIALLQDRPESAVSLSLDEQDYLDSLPADDVLPILFDRFRTTNDRTTRSRAYDALLHNKSLDQVAFLVDLYDHFSGWQTESCRQLARYQDARAIATLCDIIRNAPDGTVRYVAAESLAINGNATALPTLEYVSAHDKGEDYEGFSVADEARAAIERIRERMARQ